MRSIYIDEYGLFQKRARKYYIEQVLFDHDCPIDYEYVNYDPVVFWQWLDIEFGAFIQGTLDVHAQEIFGEPRLTFRDDDGYSLFILRFL